MAAMRIKAYPVSFNESTGDIIMQVWFEGNTYEHKDAIKALGGWRYGCLDLMTWENALVPKDAWYKKVKLSDLQDVLTEAETVEGAHFDPETGINEAAMYAAKNEQRRWQAEEAEEAERNAERAQRIARVERPAIPSLVVGRYWNHRIYGRQGHQSIYLDRQRVDLTDVEAAELETYLKKYAEYTETREAARKG